MQGGSAPNDWPGYYRGYRLQANPSGEVWWQVYNGTERLYLDPVPEQAVERLLALKSLGGRMHVTEEGEVLTKVEDGDSYREVWLDTINLEGELKPAENPDQAIPVRPEGLSPGDLWPSVYDGSRFSFVSHKRVWWKNPETHQRHYVEEPLPDEIGLELNRYKSQGGSFRVTPWGDVITLIPFHPRPAVVEDQFSALSAVVRNIIKLRKQRGVEMLPIYVGHLGDYQFEILDAQNLSEPLSPDEARELESWAKSLGRTKPTSSAAHRAKGDQPPRQNPDEEAEFDDDPENWGKSE